MSRGIEVRGSDRTQGVPRALGLGEQAPRQALLHLVGGVGGDRREALQLADVAGRAAGAPGRCVCAARKLESLLAPYGRRSRSHSRWTDPPPVTTEERLVLPSWTGA